MLLAASARKRFEKRRAAGDKNAWRLFVVELRSLKSLKKVINYCQRRKGCHVVFKGQNNFDPDVNEISLSLRSNYERVLITLLHEVGHLLWNEKHRNNLVMDRSYVFRWDVLREEIEAWNEGEKLANRLKINVDKKNFNKVKNACLRSYALWATRSGFFKGSRYEVEG